MKRNFFEKLRKARNFDEIRLHYFCTILYENTKLVELATCECLVSVRYLHDILRLEGDGCLISCWGGMSREIIDFSSTTQYTA